MSEEKALDLKTGSTGSVTEAEMTVPGYPRMRTRDQVQPFLEEELCTTDLDELSPWLWLMTGLMRLGI